MPCSTWLLAVALFMVATLFVVPRRWRLWPGPHDGDNPGSGVTGEAVPTGGAPVAWRGLVFGFAALATAAVAVCAPTLFPLSTGVQTVATPDGGSYLQQAWAALAPLLVIPLMLAGLVVLGWACVQLAAPSCTGGGDTAA